MTLKKGFLQPDSLSVPKYKYPIGIILGLVLAFYLYSLQYMTREAIRWFSISDDDLWLLSDSEVSFYNLIFAFISIIVGQSFCFIYWFHRPLKVHKLKAGRLQSIIHEQRFFNWYVLAWFSKTATMYGILFAMAGTGGYYVVSMYPYNNYVFILIVIVMFFQVWNSILLTFKRRAYKWIMLSFTVVSLLSFGLSKINMVDYKILNEKVVSKQLEKKYHLRLPTSNVYQTQSRRLYYVPNISLVKTKNENKPILLVDDNENTIASLTNEILKIKNKLPLELQLGMPVNLKIDREIPMSFVRQINKSMALNDIEMISYIVIPKEAEYDPRYYVYREKTHVITFNQLHEDFKLELYLEQVKEYSNQINIKVTKTGCQIDDLHISYEELSIILEKKIGNDNNYAIKFMMKDELNFETYFKAISGLHEAVFILRNQESLKKFGIDYKSLVANYMRDEQKAIDRKYPLRYLEIWEEK